LFDYKDAEGTIKISANETIEVLDDTNADWILIKDSTATQGYAPSNYLQKNY
jgi:hypothetical protein